jgi:hypothetical protein
VGTVSRPYREWGVLTDEELKQRLVGIIDPAGETADAEQRALHVITLVRSNTTCLGDMDRGCY